MHRDLNKTSPVKMAAIRRQLRDWFRENGRDFYWRQPELDEFTIVICELMLQQTRAETVASVIEHFFTRFGSWQDIRTTPQSEIEKHLKPLGLWKRRSKSFKNLAIAINSNGDRLPNRREEIESLPGIGQYVANAIELLILDRPRPLLDVNMARIIERVFQPRRLADLRHDPFLQHSAKRLIGYKHAKELNFALLDLGALVCTARNPKCGTCPISRYCNYAISNSTK